KSGRSKEVLGSYDPRKTVDLLKTDRIKYWLRKGALPTGTVHNLFVTHKIVDSKKINVLPRKHPIIKEKEAEKVVVVDTPKEEVKVEAPVEAPKEEVLVETTPSADVVQ
ncbi:MAG: 30S ribosomal protein S16, partial [Patescibacteria group bacterium]